MEDASNNFPGRDDFQSGGSRRRHNGDREKRLRILVVHDFDLKSSSKLAESSLLSSNNIRHQRVRSDDPLLERSVDLCIAINTVSESSASDGLYDIDDELLPYYEGQQKRYRMLKTTARSRIRPLPSPYSYTYNGTEVQHLRGRPRIGKKTLSSSFRSIPIPTPLPPVSQPIFYERHNSYESHGNGGVVNCGGAIEAEDHNNNENTQCDSGQTSRAPTTTRISPEERAARRGLITAALSQLESIVCRVAYVLKNDDDNSDDDKKESHVHLRLTSNSLDIRNRWLPLVEGLGVAGLVEGPETPPIERSPSSSGIASDTHSDGSECDSNDDSPFVFPSEREQQNLHRETSGSSSSPVAVVSTYGDEGSCTDAVATSKQHYGNGNYNNYSGMLEGLLRSAHPLRISGRERDAYTNNGKDPFPKDREGPRFQSIVVAAAPAPIKAPAKSEMAADEFGKGEASSCPLHLQMQKQKADEAFVGDHLLLEITAGSEGPPSSHSRSLCGSSISTTVVVPGSLRTRGEFCLVDLVLQEQIEVDVENSSDHCDRSSINSSDPGNPQRSNRWRVERTHFHRLESERHTRDSA